MNGSAYINHHETYSSPHVISSRRLLAKAICLTRMTQTIPTNLYLQYPFPSHSLFNKSTTSSQMTLPAPPLSFLSYPIPFRQQTQTPSRNPTQQSGPAISPSLMSNFETYLLMDDCAATVIEGGEGGGGIGKNSESAGRGKMLVRCGKRALSMREREREREQL